MKQIIIYFFLLLTLTTSAQYRGGQGDGADKKQIIQTALNGVIGGVRVLYQGGSGDGFHKGSFASFLNGTSSAAIYGGGSGDGHSVLSASSFLQGTNAAALYAGGAGDGFSVNNFQAFLNGTSSAMLYGGGQGDGFSTIAFNGFLNSLPASVLYSGGAGDGFSRNNYNGFLGGFNSNMLYGGGMGDGFAVAAKESFINGVPSSILYSGGGGDGFARADYTGTVVVLPLELISFDATAKKDYVLVQWVTESEVGTSFFTVERSQAGRIFNGLVNVAASGSPTTTHKYNINDSAPLPGRSFYRLKWTDKDGKKGYSDIRSVVFNQSDAEAKDFLLFPNPNDGTVVNVQLDGLTAGDDIKVGIYDAEGRSILQVANPTISGNRIVITLPTTLSKGTYAVRVIRAGKAATKMMIVR